MSIVVGTWPAGSPEWHAARAGTIGGSEIGAACGLSPHESRDELLARKAGLAEPRPETNAMLRGTLLEPAILAWVMRQHPEWTLDVEASAATYAHNANRRVRFNPDGIVVGTDGQRVLIECKTTSDRTTERGWGRAGTSSIPPHYEAQVALGLEVLGIEGALVAVLAGGINGRPSLKFAAYKLARNKAHGAFLLRHAERFLADLDNLTSRAAAA